MHIEEDGAKPKYRARVSLIDLQLEGYNSSLDLVRRVLIIDLEWSQIFIDFYLVEEHKGVKTNPEGR